MSTQLLNTDRTAATSVAFTAARTWILPQASTCNGGQLMSVIDNIGTVTATNTLTVQAHSGDTIDAGTTVVLNAAWAEVLLICDGVSNWKVVSLMPLPLSKGGTGAITAAAARSILGAAASGANSDITSLTGLATPIPINEGGTAQITAAAARGPSGLNIDEMTTHGDSNYTIAATDRTVATTTTLTALRTWTLPAASALNAGQSILITDKAGAINSTNTIAITAAGADTIAGGTTVTLTTAHASSQLVSDGVSTWTNYNGVGANGGPGPTGAAGAAGSVWRDGTGAPSSGLGVNGDYYLDDSTGKVYTKAAGAYTNTANITGPTGPTGPTGATGSGTQTFALNQFRLTTTSHTPITTTDVINAGTLYLAPLGEQASGGATSGTAQIALPSGTTGSWPVLTSAQVSLALTVTSGKLYDVFAYSASGTLTLALGAAWTNSTTRLNALGCMDGIPTNSVTVAGQAANKCLYLGTIYASGTNVTADALLTRYLANYWNPVIKPCYMTDTTTRNTSSLTPMQVGSIQISYVSCLGAVMIPVTATGHLGASGASGNGFMTIGSGSTAIATGAIPADFYNATSLSTELRGTALLAEFPPAGLVTRYMLYQLGTAGIAFYVDSSASLPSILRADVPC